MGPQPAGRGDVAAERASGESRDANVAWWRADPRIESPSWQWRATAAELAEGAAWAESNDMGTVSCTEVGFLEADIIQVVGGSRRESRQLDGIISPLSQWKSGQLALSLLHPVAAATRVSS